MKIAFVCGCLEPGRDGVGDYTLSLSKRLVELGHDVLCIALNDSYVDSASPSTCIGQVCPQDSHIPSVNCFDLVRLSHKCDWQSRFKCIKKILDDYKPDWLSIQYVPYSYNRKGLPVYPTLYMRRLRGPWQIHIMFHELWVTRHQGIRKRITSVFQERIIKLTVEMLKPSIIHTSISIFQELLAKTGISSKLLPIHGSIPLYQGEEVRQGSPDSWTFVFFGSLHELWEPEPLFSFIEEARILTSTRSCQFVHLGRASSLDQSLWKAISCKVIQQKYPYYRFTQVGECPANEISRWLQRSDFGVSMAPLYWVGKSSSVAAMVDHGLPVILPNYDTKLPVACDMLFPNSSSFLPTDSTLVSAVANQKRYPIRDSVSTTALMLIKDLAS